MSCRLNLAQAYLTLARERAGCWSAARQAVRAADKALPGMEAPEKRAKPVETLPLHWQEKVHYYRKIEALHLIGLEVAIALAQVRAPSLAQQRGELQCELASQADRERALFARMFR